MSWNRNGIRLAFIVTDAPPHLDYGQQYTYVEAVHDARSAGIKLFSVGTGGLDLAGEYVLRQISQYSGAKYIFLTYGETGESEGGAPGSVSHHTGANYQTDKLEAIIIRFAKEELANVMGQPLEGEEDKPDWLQRVDAGTMKVKLAASLVGISAIHLLKSFINISNKDPEKVTMQIIIHAVFVVSALLLAVTELVLKKKAALGHGYEHK